MAHDIDIGSRSRWFHLAVVVIALLVLIATALALGSLLEDSAEPDVDLPEDEDRADTNGMDFEPPDLDGFDLDVSLEDLLGSDWGERELGEGGLDALEIDELALDELDIDGELTLGELLQPVDDERLEELEVPPPPYDIHVEPTPTPGQPLFIAVHKDGQPVPGALVSVNGEPVGQASVHGILLVQTPYEDSVTISAAPPSTARAASMVPATLPGDSRLGASPASVGHQHEAGPKLGQDTLATDNSSVTIDVPTDVTVDFETVPVPGASVQAVVTIDDRPLADVIVELDGEPVGTTASDGSVSVDVPADAEFDSTVPLRMSRDGFVAETTLPVGELALNIDSGLVALPGTSATVEVQAVHEDESSGIGGAPIAIYDDEQLVEHAITDDDGEYELTVPWSNNLTVVTVVGDETATASQTGMRTQGLLGIALAVTACVLALAWLVRRGTASEIAVRLHEAILAAGCMLTRLGVTLRRGVGRASEQGRGVLDQLSWSLLLGPLWRLASRLGTLLCLLVSSPMRLWAWLQSLHSSPAEPTDDGVPGHGPDEEDPGPTGSDSQPGTLGAHDRLLRAWQWLVGRVAGRNRARSLTPIEIEQRARARGFPAGPVRRLRRAFQDVKYGFATADDTVEDAERARDELETEAEES